MFSRNLKILLCFLIFLLLGACMSDGATQTQLATSAIAASPISTIHTAVDNATPKPSGPPFSDERNFYLDRFLFENRENGCSLPCLFDMYAGETTFQEAKQILQMRYAISISQDAYSGLPSHMFGVVGQSGDSRLYSGDGHTWNIGLEEHTYLSQVSAEFVFDKTADVLEKAPLVMVGLHWYTEDPSRYQIHLSPEQVIKNMGMPDAMYANAGGIPSSILIYETGVVFKFNPQVQLPVNGVCLGKDFFARVRSIGTLFLLSPLPEQQGEYNRVQRAVLVDIISEYNYIPLERLDMTSENLAALISEGGDACFDVPQ
jgi:hypothetical protein